MIISSSLNRLIAAVTAAGPPAATTASLAYGETAMLASAVQHRRCTFTSCGLALIAATFDLISTAGSHGMAQTDNGSGSASAGGLLLAPDEEDE